MRLIRSSKDKFLFYLGKLEKHLLLELFKLYPRIPSAGQPLSRSGKLPEQEANQRLLEEALAEQRAENKKQLQALLADSHRFAEMEKGWQLSLSRADVEWLLQILNDIRVGSWIRLGSPEDRSEKLNHKTAPDFWAMQTSGFVQMRLLEALEEGT